jgi:predicted ATPase/class 3 adenylate cyclase
MEPLRTEFPTGIVTLVFTDLEGSSEASERHGVAFEKVRDEHFRLLRAALREARGFEIETAGDALFAAFDEASNAVKFAVIAQLKMLTHDWQSLLPGVQSVRVRIGMHTGEPFIGRDEATGRPVFRGPATNRAARVQGAAHGGQILVSHATQTLAKQALPPDVVLFDCGTHRLKGIGEEQIWQVCHPQLPREFPPLATLNPQRHNLPMPPSPLIGRETEVAQWHELLRRPTTRLLTLCAFGGMGKTRAALQLAEVCASENAEWTKNGVWWVELDEARSADAMMARIAANVRLRVESGLPLKEQLWNFLRERSLLLVLDNTEQIADAGKVVNEILQAAPRVKCLVTTRQPLDLRAEIKREVTPLPPDEAVRLFIESVQNDGGHADADDDAVREICRRLEGVPLALELAASRAGMLSPAEILSHLDDQFRLLRSRAPDLPPRQRALRGAIDWSYELLAEDEKNLFAELAVFAGGFTLDDAKAVCVAGDVFDGVFELHRHSLLRSANDAQSGQTRYSMLESLRAYAAEKLGAEPALEDAARRRHAAYFASQMDKIAAQLRSRGEGATLAQGAAHLDNARAALRFALEKQDVLLTARLSLSLGRVLQRHGSFREAAARFQSGLDAAPDDTKLRAALHFERAGAHYDSFEWELSQALLDKALAIFEAENDAVGQADAWNLRGLLAMRGENNLVLAQECFSRAVHFYRAGACRVGLALSQNNRGLAEHQKQNHDAARQHFQAALEAYRAEGYQRGIAESLNNLGVLAQDQKRFDEADQHYAAALAIELGLDNQFGVARALYNLGEIAATFEQHEKAFRCFAVAAVLFERVGSPYVKYAHAGRAQCADRGQSINDDLAGLHEKSLGQLVQWAQQT